MLLATVLGVASVFAGALGINNFRQSQPSDKKAQTALNVNSQKLVSNDISSSDNQNTNDKQDKEGVLDFQEERQKVEQQKVTDVQSSELGKEDKELALRIEAFKFSQEKLGINLNSLDEVVASQIKAGNIEISDSLSLTRAKYVVAFYAQFPGTQAGKTCKALLDGKKVSLDKDTFNKWNQNLGKHGGKFTMTLKGKKVKLKNFSAMDYYKDNHKAQH